MITFVLIFIKAYSEQKHDIEIKYYRPFLVQMAFSSRVTIHYPK